MSLIECTLIEELDASDEDCECDSHNFINTINPSNTNMKLTINEVNVVRFDSPSLQIMLLVRDSITWSLK